MAHLHQHHHDHDHGHCGKSLGERNKEHFDGAAATVFQTPWIAKLTDQVSLELQNNFAWISQARKSQSQETKLLDYACGNGMASRALANHVSSSRGIDISSSMVEQYNLLANESSTQHKMHAIQGDLLDMAATPSANLDTSEYKNFDFAIMSLALHHVENVDDMVKRLAERLVDGGVLVIVDWVADSESGCKIPPLEDMPVAHTVNHMGFREDDLRGTFERAGLGDWGWKWFGERSEVPSSFGGEQQGFLARGTKRS